MTRREELLEEKIAMQEEYKLIRNAIKSVTTHNGMQNLQLEINKLDTRLTLIDKELELVQLEENFLKENTEK